MTAKDEKHLLAFILAVQVALIVWLLTRRKAAIFTAPNSKGSPGLTLSPATYDGSTYTIPGLTTSPLNLSLVFPGTDPQPVPSCDCGCDENSPLNVAEQGLARFVNQYQNGLFDAQKGFVATLANALPDWMTQYINSGGGAFGSAGL